LDCAQHEPKRNLGILRAEPPPPRHPLRPEGRVTRHGREELDLRDRGRPGGLTDFAPLWDDVAGLAMPVMLVRGGDSKFVPDADARRFRDLQPTARLQTVPDSGHAVQSDQPLVLTRLITDFALN
jgi:pimeloyl-ACP methyl ester carboxylesterase